MPMQRIAHKELPCDCKHCPYGGKISTGESYVWDVRLGHGWDRRYHLDCHKRALVGHEIKHPETYTQGVLPPEE